MTMLELNDLERPWTTCEWLHANRFREWLEAQGVEPTHLEPTMQRQWSGWGLDQMVLQVGTADEVLTRLGFHLSMLDDDCWALDHERNYNPSQECTVEKRKRARALRFQGATCRQIVAATGMSKRTVHNWVRDIEMNVPVLLPKPVAAWIKANVPQDARWGDHRLGSALSRWASGEAVPQTQTVASVLKPYGKALDDLPANCWKKGRK